MRKRLLFRASVGRSCIIMVLTLVRCAALTAYNALHGPVPIKAGDYVLVLGTGGVSMWVFSLSNF